MSISYRFNFWIALVMCVMYGMNDGMTQPFMQCVCGFQYKDQTIPYCCMQIYQNIGATGLYTLCRYLTTQKDYIRYLSSLMGFNFLTFSIMVFWFEWKEVPTRAKVESVAEIPRDDDPLISKQ